MAGQPCYSLYPPLNPDAVSYPCLGMEHSPIYADRDLSWLSFNYRVLLEAQDPQVPLADRVKFLAIYSANLDEFFRVRVATLRRLAALGHHKRNKLPMDPQVVLAQIADTVARQQQDYETLFEQTLIPELRRNGVVLGSSAERYIIRHLNKRGLQRRFFKLFSIPLHA